MPETVATIRYAWNYYASGGETQGDNSGRVRAIRMRTAKAGRTHHCENCGATIARGEQHWTNDYQPQYDRVCMRCGQLGGGENA